MREYPSVNYPTILEGEIWGPIRCESMDGSEMYLPEIPSPSSKFKNFKPFERDGKTWAVTHLQKKSKRGWIKTDPDGYHWWYFWKLQEPGKPGSERGIYFRKPFSWRWDVAGTVINGVLDHWVWTKGYLGSHWD